MPFHSQIAAASLSMNVGAEQGFGTSRGGFAAWCRLLFDFEMARPSQRPVQRPAAARAHGTSDSFLSTVQAFGGARGSGRIGC
jgi:hypothetical protein